MKHAIRILFLLPVIIVCLNFPAFGTTFSIPDLDNDEKIGLSELVYMLQVLSGVRSGDDVQITVEKTSGTISGTLFESLATADGAEASRAPLAGADVTLIPVPDNFPMQMLDTLVADLAVSPDEIDAGMIQALSGGGEAAAPRAVATDENGVYCFDDTPAGRYVLIGHTQGFKMAVGIVVVAGGGTYQMDLLTYPETFPGEGILFGRVLEKVNAGDPGWRQTVPVSGVQIRLYPANDTETPWGRAVSDSSGRFYFFGIPPGDYLMTALHDDFEPYQQPVVISEGVHMPLPVLATVLTEDGVDAPGAGSLTETPAGAGAQGLYSLMELMKNEWGGCFCMGPFGSWHFGVNFVKVVLKRTNHQPDTMISGHVFGFLGSVNGPAKPVPIPCATVTASPYFPYPVLAPLPLLTAVTDENGHYEFSGLPDGYAVGEARIWIVSASVQGYQTATDRVKVPPGTHQVVDFTLDPEVPDHGALSGHVYDAILDFGPVAGASVTIAPLRWTDAADQAVIAEHTTITDEDGFFHFDHLRAGPHRMWVKAKAYQLWQGEVEIVSGETVFTEVQLMPLTMTASLGGRVTDGLADCATGADCILPVAGARVTILASLLTDAPQVLPQTTVYTDEEGYYHFKSLPAGDYPVMVEADGYQAWHGDVTLLPGQENVLNIELMPVSSPSTLTGYVFDGAANCPQDATEDFTDPSNCLLPVAGATVTLTRNIWWDGNAAIPEFVTTTDENGFYALGDLPAGTHLLRVEADGYESFKGEIRILAGQENTRNIYLMPISAVTSLSGKVYDGAVDCAPGTDCILPVVGAQITLIPKIWHEDARMIPVFEAKTDETGFYRFDDIPAGMHHMHVTAENYESWEGVVEITAGMENVKNLQLMPLLDDCMDNDACPDDGYCKKTPGQCEGPGHCTPRPEVCPLYYAPVCGCDGNTYSNACGAAANGVNVDYSGECRENNATLDGHVYNGAVKCADGSKCIVPVEGVRMTLFSAASDGSLVREFETYTDETGFYCFKNVRSGIYYITAEKAGFFGAKDTVRLYANKVVTLDLRMMPGPAGCTENGQCPDGYYCAKAAGDCDGEGECRPIPDAWIEIYDPVCGCDNQTYDNAGAAAGHGVSVDFHGTCE